MSFEAFLEAEDRGDSKHEWLDGVVYDMSRGTPEHGRLSAAIARELGEAVTNPALIVEVLSESTEKYDRGEKLAHYMRLPSLAEYALVAHDQRRIEVLRRPEHGHWAHTIATAGGVVELHGRPIHVDAVYG